MGLSPAGRAGGARDAQLSRPSPHMNGRLDQGAPELELSSRPEQGHEQTSTGHYPHVAHGRRRQSTGDAPGGSLKWQQQ